MPDAPRNDLVENARKALLNVQLVIDVLPLLLARDSEQVGPDGYPAGGGEGPGSDISRPTENAALVRLGHMPLDLVHEWTDDILRSLDAIVIQANRAAGLVAVIEKYVDSKTGRQSSLKECLNCAMVVHPPDRLRSGRCATCYVYRLRDPEQRDRPKALWT